MDIRPSSLRLRGRWRLGLYSPDSVPPGRIAAGSEDVSRGAADLQKEIFNSLTAFLDDFGERGFERGRRESQAVGAVVIGAADCEAAAFAEKNVIIGKFRQPPPDSDRFRLDAEGNRRLSAFASNSASAAGEVSFRTVARPSGATRNCLATSPATPRHRHLPRQRASCARCMPAMESHHGRV